MMKSLNWLIVIFLVAEIAVTVHAGPPQEVTAQQVMEALPKLSRLAQDTLRRTGVPGMAIIVVYKD